MTSTRDVKVEHLLQDLLWLLRGEEVITADESFATFLCHDWQAKFAALEEAPSSLCQFISESKSHFLGAYFERLFSFAVEHFTTLEVVAEHQQIFSGKTTKGELDLVARDVFGNVILFEVALKFYLERPDLAPNNWIGPNKNDSLYKKVSHARIHQLELLEDAEGRDWLKAKTDNDTYHKNLLIFGRLFQHMPELACGSLGADDFSHRWLYISELSRLAELRATFHQAHKPYWITKNRSDSQKPQTLTNVITSLTSQFQLDERPQLYSCNTVLETGELGSFWLFICPDSW